MNVVVLVYLWYSLGEKGGGYMIFKIGSSLISRDVIFNEKVFLMLLGIPLRIGLFEI